MKINSNTTSNPCRLNLYRKPNQSTNKIHKNRLSKLSLFEKNNILIIDLRAAPLSLVYQIVTVILIEGDIICYKSYEFCRTGGWIRDV